MPFIRANGIRIAFDCFGSMKRRPLFLIHGLTGQRMSLEGMAELTARTRMRGENVVTLTPEETAAVNRALLGFDLRPGLAAVACPALVIAGTYDRINPPAFGREIADGLPRAQYAEFPGGHMLTLECEEDYLRCLRAFLAQESTD